MDKLKPCPFCGKEPYMQERYIAQNKKQWSIACQCGARFFPADTKGKAIKLWNRRADNG